MRRDFTHSGEIMTIFGEISPNPVPAHALARKGKRKFAACGWSFAASAGGNLAYRQSDVFMHHLGRYWPQTRQSDAFMHHLGRYWQLTRQSDAFMHHLGRYWQQTRQSDVFLHHLGRYWPQTRQSDAFMHHLGRYCPQTRQSDVFLHHVSARRVKEDTANNKRCLLCCLL